MIKVELINKEVIIGTLKYLTFRIRGDHSNRRLTFLMKETPSSHVKIIEKKNALAGGTDTQFNCVFGGVYSDFSIKFEVADTEGKNAGYYSFTIISVSNTAPTEDVDFPVSGYVNLVPNIQLPEDISYIAGDEYANQVYDKILLAQVGTGSQVDILQDIGFNAVLTGSKLGTGIYQITSNLPIFTTQLEVECTAFNPSSLMTLPAFNNNLGHSLTELQIGVYDINSELVIDIDFLLTLKRIRS